MVIVANMNDSKPFRNFIEFVLDWQLIYRDSRKMRALAPEAGPGRRPGDHRADLGEFGSSISASRIDMKTIPQEFAPLTRSMSGK